MISKPVYYLLYSCGAYTYSYEGRETPGIFLQLKLAKLLKLILQRQDGLKYEVLAVKKQQWKTYGSSEI